MTQTQGTSGHLLAGRYRLGEVLGRGGMGTVWRAIDETLGRPVAVKELRLSADVDDEERRRLITRTLREAKATAQIPGTSAVTVFDVVEEDDRPWIVMELVEGRSLSEVIRDDGPLTPRRAAEVALAVLDVLQAAHDLGIIHRDVKPSNVILADDGRTVLTDFGIAQVEGDPSVTSTGMLVGAPSYISPERARGRRPGPASDLWSLGALVYASVEGHPPYDRGSAIATLTAVMTDPVEPPKNAGGLTEAIYGLLRKDPAERLDGEAARDIFAEVSNAPEAPVPADPPAAANPTSTVALPPPQDTAPNGGSAGNAAPAPGGPVTGKVPPKRLIVIAAVVAIALIGAALGLVIALTGDSGSDKASGTHTGQTKGKASQPATTSETGGPSSSKSDGSGQPATASASSPAGKETASAGDKGKSATPAGYHHYTDGEGFSVALPNGWRRVDDNGYGSGSKFAAPGDPRKLQIDFTHTPGKDAAAAWREADKHMTRANYHQIYIKSVNYNGWEAADWEFTYTDSGITYHVINRGFVVDRSHGYAIMWTVPEDQWGSAKNQKVLDTLFATFNPAD